MLITGCGDDPLPQDIDDPDPTPTFDIEGSWDGRGGLAEPLTGVSAAVWRGSVYVVGGYSGTAAGTATQHVVKFDTATFARTVLGDYPDRVAEGALVVYRDTLLMIGGNGGTEASLAISSAIRWYDEVGDRWESWGALPERRFRHTAHVVDDRLYVIGGRNFSRPPGDSIVVFDGRSSNYGPPPNREYSEPMTGGVVEDTIFVVTSSFDSRVMRYHAAGDDWADPIGNPLDGLATGGVVDGRMHVFSHGQLPEHRVWDAESSAWLTARTPSSPVERAAVVDVTGTLWLIGGHDRDRTATNRMQIFTPG